jgi:hypothetical protein
MGPYCKYCRQRCFVPVTATWPKHIIKAYKGYQLAATCVEGQIFEKAKLGYCYNEVKGS